jgi:hypothetical protein
MEERRSIQTAAASLAASAFIATTQILTHDSVDLALQIALVLFAVNIPFQILLFLTPIAQRIRPESRPLSRIQWIWPVIGPYSTCLILIGFVAMFWHFAWWLGVLFGLATLAAFLIFHSCVQEFRQRFRKQTAQDN